MLLPGLLTMCVLLLCSAFFSASEAALFSLRRAQRRELSKGSGAQQIIARLLDDPDRLLTAVLFWNLLINLSFFTIGSILSLRMRAAGHATAVGAFAVGSLATIIIFGEMLPKSLGVLQAQRLAAWLAIPLAATIRVVDPLLPVFRLATLLSRRLLWPNFQPEPYLHVRDLERAVKLSGADATLVDQEARVLESIVLLSDIRAEELMRPRTQFISYHPPVTLADLKARPPLGSYLLVTEAGSDEVAAAIALDDVWRIPDGPLDLLAEPVIYVPWSTRAADVLELIRGRKREVAAVVNEFGETIGILTFDDILDTLFSGAPSRSERLLRRDPIRPIGPGTWHVTGMTSVRRLARYFQIEKPATHCVTLAGVIQEVLERLPAPGDECSWGPFHFKILDVPLRGQLLIELTMPEAGEEGLMIWTALGLGIFGLFLSAFFSGSETGFYRATRLRLVLDAMGGDRIARGLLFLTNHPALFVATALVGNSAANSLISLATVIAMGRLFPQVPEAAEIVASIVLAPIVLVYGELLPKNLFLQAPNRLLRSGGGLFLFFVALFFPLAGLLWLLGRWLARATRTSHEPVRLVLAQRELRRILAEGHEAGILHPAQQNLAHGILAVARKPVRQFLTSPGEMAQVRADASKQAVLGLAQRRHTAVVPVSAPSGRLVGYVRVLDLHLHQGDDVAPIRPLPEIADTSSHLAALMRLESSGDSLAQVVNARGETVGLVTLERLREPLF